jgi:2,4-dienoyl-CoA reductase-like NADH-dependent reductase (Old Yellow Enzyme family)
MLQEFKLKDNIVLRNRIVVAPMTTWSANDDLTVSNEELEYYAARSKGAGMVITGGTFFQKNGQGFENEFYAGTDEYIPSLKKLANAIKSNGAKAILQIFHAGRMAIPGKGNLISASVIKPSHGAFGMGTEVEEPKAMTEEDIQDFIQGFYETTRRAIQAGFDGIEIHGANTFLIQQFYSGESNRRTDKWGGTRENRIQLPLQIIDAANRAKNEFADNDFIIGYRFSPEEIEEKGITLDDTLYFVDRLVNESIDYLNVSLNYYKQTSIRNSDDKRIIGKLLIEKIAGRKPLIGVGRILTKEDAQEALQNVGYDMIGLGQAIIMNPDWVYKVQNNLPVEQAVDLNDYKSIKIPEGLMNVIKSTPGWFTFK